MADRFLIFGHRGSPLRYPENTLTSFEATLRGGADGFETDLRLLRDQTAVLFHDDELGGDPIESLTAEQCAERGAVIERLDALAVFNRRATMILEVKRSGWEDVLLEHVRQWERIIVASFDHSLVVDLHLREPNIPLGITIHGAIVDVARYAQSLGATWCFPNFRYIGAGMVAELHERDIRIVPWTANRKEEWEVLLEMGCDGLITDLPDEAVAWRDRK